MSAMEQHTTEAGVIADLAERTAARELLNLDEGGRLVGFVLAAGQSLETVDLERYGDRPARKTGTVIVHNGGSFARYVNRHKVDAATTLWGDVDHAKVVAVLDDHVEQSDDAGWAQHRAVLNLPVTIEWAHWLKNDGKLLGQSDFAEHVEDGAHVITSPDPATMLEIAQSFRATTGVEFKSSSRLSSGETQLRYEETTTAKAGKTGGIDIPELFTLRVAPFEGSPEYEITARLRYRINNGQLLLGYRLIRPEQAKRAAFSDVLTEIGEATGLDVLHGTPRP